jgi:O-antigen ligase
MTSRTSSRRRHSSSGHHEGRRGKFPAGFGVLITTVLLTVILVTGPVFLGSDREWIDLPICGGTALLLLVQGLRLALVAPTPGRRRLDAIDLSVLVFVAYAIVRWLTSPTEYFSRLEVLDVIGYAGIFLTCRHGMANRHFAVFLLYVLVILGVSEAAFGYYFINHLDWFPFGPNERNQLQYAPRWLGTYGCPNNYGSLLVMAAGAALALGCFSKLSWPVRIVCLYLALMLMVGVVYSGSRGSWIALLVAVSALVLWGIRQGTLRWWFPVTAALVLGAVAVGLFCFSQVGRERSGDLLSLLNSGNLNAYVRVELARDALRIAHDHPLFGTGPATFEYIHERYQDSTFRFKAVLAHDDYLNCLDDYGIVGFGIAMFFVWAVTLKFFRPLDVDNRWQDRVLVATGFAAWAALLIHSFVDFNLHIPGNARMLFALTGLALGRFKQEPELMQHWSTISLSRLGRWLGVGLIILSLAYGALATKTAVSDIIYETAFGHRDEVPLSESIDATNEALSYDQANPNALAFLGDLYRYRASRQKEMEGRLELGQKALDAYQKAAAANPLDDTITASMGMTFDVMRRYPEAFFCYSRAVTEQPYNGQFWYRLGNHYWARGMLEKAEQAYLLSATSPHGFDGGADAEFHLRHSPEMQGVPRPAPGTNPLTSPSNSEAPETLP